MIPASAEFQSTLHDIRARLSSVEGHLTERELSALAWMGAARVANGEVLEIGSFYGRSTIVLALATKLAGDRRVVAVDPLTSPSVTDPALKPGETSGLKRFEANLTHAGVRERVEFHQTFSTELARAWDAQRMLRLLWIDGDHTYAGVKADIDAFRPFLADGAIVAMHDVLNRHGGPARVFCEDILLSPHFGAAGFSGSIGWSQFFRNAADAAPFRETKLALYRKLSRTVAYTAFGDKLNGKRSLGFRLARARVPHRELDRAAWVREVQDRSA